MTSEGWRGVRVEEVGGRTGVASRKKDEVFGKGRVRMGGEAGACRMSERSEGSPGGATKMQPFSGRRTGE